MVKMELNLKSASGCRVHTLARAKHQKYCGPKKGSASGPNVHTLTRARHQNHWYPNRAAPLASVSNISSEAMVENAGDAFVEVG